MGVPWQYLLKSHMRVSPDGGAVAFPRALVTVGADAQRARVFDDAYDLACEALREERLTATAVGRQLWFRPRISGTCAPRRRWRAPRIEARRTIRAGEAGRARVPRA